jgi:HK97 family phage major capsid protein
MNKHFIRVAGKMFACDEHGALAKNADGSFVELTETNGLSEVSLDKVANTEITNALNEAVKQVKANSASDLASAQVEAEKAVANLFNSIADSAKKNTKVSEGGEVKTSFDVAEVKNGLKDLYTKKRNAFSFSFNSLKELAVLNSVSESESLTGDVIQPQVVAEITRDPVRQVFIESIADVTPNMTSDALSYVECVNESGAPLPTAELNALPEKDFTFQEFKATLKKIGVTNKHSMEILNDAAQLVAAFKGWLQEDVNIVTDQQLLTGSGSGDNLTGVYTMAETLDATAVGTKRVAHANLADVIRVAITKIAVAGKGKFIANYVILNPEDADALDLTKDENGQYVLPPFKTSDGTTIKGARVIENVGMTAGKFLVGDFRKLHIGTKGGVTVTMTDSDGTDFSKDIVTVKLTRRVAAYVRQNDNGAFWAGDISDVIDALIAS